MTQTKILSFSECLFSSLYSITASYTLPTQVKYFTNPSWIFYHTMLNFTTKVIIFHPSYILLTLVIFYHPYHTTPANIKCEEKLGTTGGNLIFYWAMQLSESDQFPSQTVSTARDIEEPQIRQFTLLLRIMSLRFEQNVINGWKCFSFFWRIPGVKRAGNVMRSMAKAEPLKKKGWERDDCFPCTTGGGNCERNGSGYRICCLGCLRAGRCTEYDGETGNNGYTRGKEQADGLRLESEENALWKP